MTDRELLELAAKAAGIDLIPYTWSKGTGWDHDGFTRAGHGDMEWNPLEDNGDSLELAVMLGLMIDTSCQPALILCAGPQGIGLEESARINPLVATRRIIVRAAAEIGKTK